MAPSWPRAILKEGRSSRSSASDSESIAPTGKSGGAVALLSLRRLSKQGPTLVSRLWGVAEDCLLLFVIVLDARLEILRIRLVVFGRLVLTPGVSGITFGLLVTLCPCEFRLVSRVMMDSGN